jgi:choline dehydrogenase-like flavoprotein
MSDRYDVLVVGSGAGGGVVAGELADRGRRVLLLEVGPHKTAADYMRWDPRALHELWWPPAFAEPAGAPGPPMILLRGRCVGGTTAINTKVALRPDAEDYAKWHSAAGLVGAGGEAFAEADLLPYLERVERRLGVRERSDWQQCVRTVVPGFKAQPSSSPSCPTPTRTACAAAPACRVVPPTRASRRSTPTSTRRGRADSSSSAPAATYDAC